MRQDDYQRGYDDAMGDRATLSDRRADKDRIKEQSKLITDMMEWMDTVFTDGLESSRYEYGQELLQRAKDSVK